MSLRVFVGPLIGRLFPSAFIPLSGLGLPPSYDFFRLFLCSFVWMCAAKDFEHFNLVDRTLSFTCPLLLLTQARVNPRFVRRWPVLCSPPIN